ncbi:DUF397 domain-containing protein [Streptomyces harbinensis]
MTLGKEPTATTGWRRSSYSTNGGNCVEVREGLAEVVPVRDSKSPNGPILTFTKTCWSDFLHSIQNGERCS